MIQRLETLDERIQIITENDPCIRWFTILLVRQDDHNPFYRVRTIEFLVDLHITSQLKELGHVEIRARLVVYKDHFLLIDETLDAAVNRTTKTFSNNNLLGKGDLVVVLDALVPVEEGLD